MYQTAYDEATLENIRVVSAVQEEEKDRHREFVILQVVDCLLSKVHELNGRLCDEVTGVSTEVTHCERRHQLLVCTGGDIGHFDNEIDMAGIEGMEGIKASTKGVNQLPAKQYYPIMYFVDDEFNRTMMTRRRCARCNWTRPRMT